MKERVISVSWDTACTCGQGGCCWAMRQARAHMKTREVHEQHRLGETSDQRDGHFGPSRPIVVDNSRLVPYTPQSVAASLAAVKRAEHAALNQSQNALEHAQKIPNPHRFRESQPACMRVHTHTQRTTGRTRPTHIGDSSASHNTPSSVVMFDHTDHIKSYHPMHVFLPPASPWIMQAVPSYTDTWAGLIRSCEVHAVNPYR